jgi:hypothetical protein
MTITKSAVALLTEARRAKTPEGYLAKVAAAREAHAETETALKTATHDAIVNARDGGMSWPSIGAAFGISAQRAQQLARPIGGDPVE